MKQLKLYPHYMLSTSDRATEIVVRALLFCSIVIVACECYILLKLYS